MCPFQADCTFLHKMGGQSIDLIIVSAGADGDLPGVQPHVSTLNAVGDQGTHGGQFWRSTATINSLK